MHPVPPHGFGGRYSSLVVSMIPTADVSHTAFTVPIADHGNERIATFPVGQQSCISDLGPIPFGWSSLQLQEFLHMFPFLFFLYFYNPREEFFMPIPVRFFDILDLSVVRLPAMVVSMPVYVSSASTFFTLAYGLRI